MYIKARHGQRTRKQEIGQIARLEQIEMRMVRWMVSKDVEEREKWGGGCCGEQPATTCVSGKNGRTTQTPLL